MKLDRLRWEAAVCGTAYGRRIGIRLNTTAVPARLLDCLPPGWKPSRCGVVDRLYSLIVGTVDPHSTVRRFHLLYQGAMRLARTTELGETMDGLRSDLERYVAEEARGAVFVHAGVVGWRGQAIVIPGRSFTGKTTLVASLIAAGADYYSDEYAVLDRRGRVHPFARALTLRSAVGHDARRGAAASLPRRAGIGPLPLGLIVITHYRPDGTWHPRTLSPGQGLLALMANTVAVRRQPGATLRVLRRAAAHARVLEGVRGEADSAIGALLSDHAEATC